MEQNRAFGQTPISGKIKQTEHARSGLFFFERVLTLFWFPPFLVPAEQRSGWGGYAFWGRQAFGQRLWSVPPVWAWRAEGMEAAQQAYGVCHGGGYRRYGAATELEVIANPNAGLHEYAFSMGLGGRAGSLNPAGDVSSLRGRKMAPGSPTQPTTGGNPAIKSAVGWRHVGEAVRRTRASACCRRCGTGPASKVASPWASRGYRILAEWRRPGSCISSGPTSAAALGAMAAARWVKCFVAGTEVWVPCLMINCQQPTT